MLTREEAVKLMREGYDSALGGFQLERVADYFSRDYVQTVNGKTLKYEEFLDHLEQLKAHAGKLKVSEFRDVVWDGEKQALTLDYNVEATMKDGRVSSAHFIAVFRFDDEGKICYCNELSVPLEAGDRAMAELAGRTSSD